MEGDHLPLDELPYVCLWHVCSFLPPENLAILSSTSKTMYDVCSSEELWRDISLSRWQFCNINQISQGPQRWQRYFRARRQVESRMDAGRPTKDYRVKTLRGHGADVMCAVCLDGSSGDLENPTAPIIISLSSDHVVYAWDVTEGKPVWTLEGRQVSSIAGLNTTVAIGDSEGHVTIHRTSDWSEVAKLAPPTQDRIVTALEFVCIVTEKKTFNCILVCYCIDDGSCEIAVINLEGYQPLTVLTTDSVCTMLSVKGAWLAAAQEQSASEVYVWDLTDVMAEPPPTATPPPSLSPHVTLHVNNNCGRPLVWIKPGTLITIATGQANQFLPPPMPPVPIPIPGQVHIMQPRHIIPAPMFPGGFQATLPGSDMEVWEVAKYIDGTKKRPSQVFIVRRMYDSNVVKLSCFPRAVAYSNGFLVTGDDSGCVRVLDVSDGKCLQEFSDHKGPITDIYADGYRVLTCSKDFSIRVYSWLKEGGVKPSYKLLSRYQLLGGSVALKTHDGFCRVLCQSGSCVGVAGNQLKLYTFIHQLGDGVK